MQNHRCGGLTIVIVNIFSTVRWSAPLTLALFKGQLYLELYRNQLFQIYFFYFAILHVFLWFNSSFISILNSILLYVNLYSPIEGHLVCFKFGDNYELIYYKHLCAGFFVWI